MCTRDFKCLMYITAHYDHEIINLCILIQRYISSVPKLKRVVFVLFVCMCCMHSSGVCGSAVFSFFIF